MSETDYLEVNPAQWIQDTKKSGLYDIKWSMIDKRTYFPLTIANMFAIRSLLYPLTLVRTRLQVQVTKAQLYRGTFHALAKISRLEGYAALYKGFGVNSFQIFPHVLYITSFEKTRQQVSTLTNNIYLIAFAGGGLSAILAQSLSVPIDVISQHMQLVGQRGNPNQINSSLGHVDRIIVPDRMGNASTLKVAKYLGNTIYRSEGLKGFYRGYLLSTCQVSVNSALWWPFYYFYQSQFRLLLPDQLPTLFIQCLCGPFSSLSANILTNPLDVVRTRMQLTKRRHTSIQVLRLVWQEERWKMFWKGLTARLSYSCFYSFFIILGYETVKKASLKKEYVH